MDLENARGDYLTLFRLQMAQKFETDNIGDGIRPNVIFCRYERPPLSGLSMRKGRGEVGLMAPAIGSTIVRRPPQLAKLIRGFMGSLPRWLWPFRFIIIDLDQPSPDTLAHEIVHAAGHDHPDAKTLVKNLDKYLRYVPEEPTGSLVDRAITTAVNYYTYQGLFHEVKGGFFEGAANDIMSYWREGEHPSDFILTAEDKKLLDEKAKFVSP